MHTIQSGAPMHCCHCCVEGIYTATPSNYYHPYPFQCESTFPRSSSLVYSHIHAHALLSNIVHSSITDNQSFFATRSWSEYLLRISATNGESTNGDSSRNHSAMPWPMPSKILNLSASDGQRPYYHIQCAYFGIIVMKDIGAPILLMDTRFLIAISMKLIAININIPFITESAKCSRSCGIRAK